MNGPSVTIDFPPRKRTVRAKARRSERVAVTQLFRA